MTLLKVIYYITSLPFLLNGKIRKYIEIHNFDTEFIQKAIASFCVINFSSGATSVESAFQLFKKLKSQFLEGIRRTDEPKLREFLGIKLYENYQPYKILGILLDEEKMTLKMS